MSRWQIHVPEEMDRDVRQHLAATGGKRGALSEFVVRAVRRQLLSADLDTVRRRFADLSPDETDELVNDAMAWARADRS